MGVIDNIKTELDIARRGRGELRSFLSFVLATVVAVGKNSGNRNTTEDEAISCLKKLASTLEQNISLGGDSTGELSNQLQMLRSLLPQMVSEERVRDFLVHEYGGRTPNKGDAMKRVRAEYGARVDMKGVAAIYSELFS